ncbi:major facilitator superfamily domain-containing protein [Mycena capillaripes]|nr:major facilitator superfamily domain-containing protein [Mycena capillaripes]
MPRIMNFLGHFYLSDSKLALLPVSPWRIALFRPSPNTVGHSAAQARYLALILASFGPPASFIMIGAKQGFPTMFMAYIVVAFGRAILTAALNIFLSERRSKCLGYAYGVWSLGAVASPLIFQATAGAGLPWTHFYFGSLVLAASSLVFLAITFYPTTREFARDRKTALAEADSRAGRSPLLTPDTDDVPTLSSGTSSPTPSVNPLRLVASMPYQWAVSFFVLLYCGSETTTQGLIVQYLLAERSANPKTVGYVSSGFWGGITVSRNYIHPPEVHRPMLPWYASSFTIPDFSYHLAKGLALAMQLLIWFINSNLENAVSASVIGLLFGPVFPACLELVNDLLPVELNMISMAIVSAAGSLGSAIFPFVTGVVTTKYSMRCWSYVTVAQAAILFGAWFLFPTRQPPRRAVAL